LFSGQREGSVAIKRETIVYRRKDKIALYQPDNSCPTVVWAHRPKP
jgi:hypothetical protein